MYKTGSVFLLLLSFVLSSCWSDRDDYLYVPDEISGYSPIYFDSGSNMKNLVYSSAPTQIVQAGKIYVYKKYLFVGETEKGVHVFDNTDPATPIPVCFINIPYNFDISVKDTVLYADTYAGLVAISIADIPTIRFLRYIRNQISFPPLPQENQGNFVLGGGSSRTYFECIDNRKGIVVAWKRTRLTKPKCYQ